MGTNRFVVMISGGGSNLQAIIDATLAGDISGEVCAVVSNREDAYGLKRAEASGIDTIYLDQSGFGSREDYDRALIEQIDTHSPDLIVLAGYMRILSDGFIEHYRDRILNIHPSLLPAYKGLHTHQRAIEDGQKEHGASVHFVTNELDSGVVVLQAVVDIEPDDDAERLAARVLTQEHIIYPLALRWVADGRLRCQDDIAYLDDTPMTGPVRWKEEQLEH